MHRCEESIFCIEIWRTRHDYKGKFGAVELPLLTARIVLENLYTKIRSSTHALSALLGMVGQIPLEWDWNLADNCNWLPRNALETVIIRAQDTDSIEANYATVSICRRTAISELHAVTAYRHGER